jgi:SSS family transporter
LVGIGFIFSKNQHSTDDFFKGGNRIPWWAAGLSIFGTQLSAITFMAIPAKTFATDWLYFFLMMTIIMVAPFIIRFFLPFYRRFNLTTAYEYLELRFNLMTRLLGSLMYIFLQLGRLGIVLLLPSLALSVVTGIDVDVCILTMGVLSILYTVLGGIEAVIWTDVVQVIVLLGGALISLLLLYFSLDNGDISNYVQEFDKTRVFDFELSFSNPTLWVVLIGGLAANLVQYGSDQTVIQRYLTTKDEKSAAKSIMTGAWLTVPATLIFFSLGTLLFVYYKTNPELLNPVLEKTDAIFPWYIVNSLPQGVSGLLIAAVFAASMSSLDSSMNSVATVITTDFFRRLRPLSNESAYLKTARITTIIIGIIGTGFALLMASWGISSLWDQFNMIVGLFAGGLGGIFVLGIFSKRANGSGALIGLLLSGVLQYLIKDFTSVHLLLYAFTGMFSSILFGYLASLLFGATDEEKVKYTYFNLRKI